MNDNYPINSQWISKLSEKCSENIYIDPVQYTNYKVKRGLRNADGTGVIAGVTRIGNVNGYVMYEGEKMPAEGVLTYRGIDVNELIDGFVKEDRFGFEETSYLLLTGNQPTRQELAEYSRVLGEHHHLPPNFTEDMLMRAPSLNIMNKLARATLALYSYDENPDELTLENMLRQSISLIARFPTIISLAYQIKKHYYNNEPLVIRNPDPSLSSAENILRLMKDDGQYSMQEARLLDLCLVLHAEHGGGNNSAFACRVLSSSGTDTYSAIAGAIGSLKGPRHGGANLKVSEMFEDIKKNVKDWKSDDELSEYLAKIMRKEVGDKMGLVYGMGHAVYTMSDPRAVVLKKYARKLAETNGYLDEFTLLESIERLTPDVVKAVKGSNKAMCANVDLYSGIVYRMLGIPYELYTPLFATARIVSWASHRIEEVLNGGKIIRPAYKPIPERHSYIPLDERG